MKALVLESLHQALVYKEVDEPKVGKGEVLVRLKAASLNHRDVWISKGLYPGVQTPIILGSCASGITEEGRQVIIDPGFGWGDDPRFQSAFYHILGSPNAGVFAEKIAVPSANLVHKPVHLTYEEAAALPLAGLTAYRALMTKGRCKYGDKVLINGVGGGVALFACQFAIAQGAEVYVTSSSPEKIARAEALGAKGGISYRKENWGKALLKSTGGFDVIIDSAGGHGFKNLIDAAGMGGRIVFYGGTHGEINHINPQKVFWKQLQIMGSTMGTPEEFRDMVRFVEEHKIKPVVDEIFDLAQGNDAFEKMKAGKQFGKLVLKI